MTTVALVLLPLALLAGCDHPPADKFRFTSSGAPGVSIVLSESKWRLYIENRDVTEISKFNVGSIAEPLAIYRFTIAEGAVPQLPTTFSIQYNNGSVCIECPAALRNWERRSVE